MPRAGAGRVPAARGQINPGRASERRHLTLGRTVRNCTTWTQHLRRVTATRHVTHHATYHISYTACRIARTQCIIQYVRYPSTHRDIYHTFITIMHVHHASHIRYQTISHHTTCYNIMSHATCHVLSRVVSCCHVLSRVTPRHVTSRRVASRQVTSRRVM